MPIRRAWCGLIIRINDKRVQSDIHTQRRLNRASTGAGTSTTIVAYQPDAFLEMVNVLILPSGNGRWYRIFRCPTFGTTTRAYFLWTLRISRFAKWLKVVDRYRPSPLKRGKPGSSPVLTRRKNALYALSKRRTASWRTSL